MLARNQLWRGKHAGFILHQQSAAIGLPNADVQGDPSTPGSLRVPYARAQTPSRAVCTGERGREVFKVGSEIIKESPSLEHGQYQIPSCSEQSDILQNEELNMVP